ncbi:hypothetical protein STEG23_019868 [Scotinomys teguina]
MANSHGRAQQHRLLERVKPATSTGEDKAAQSSSEPYPLPQRSGSRTPGTGSGSGSYGIPAAGESRAEGHCRLRKPCLRTVLAKVRSRAQALDSTPDESKKQLPRLPMESRSLGLREGQPDP